MNPLIQFKPTIPRNSIRGLLLIPLLLACFALLPAAQAVVPAPDGGYPGFNTAEGDNALLNLTAGIENTANGFAALEFNSTGSFNTANGVNALRANTGGSDNTANGTAALFSNTTGFQNVAVGFEALFSNTAGFHNTANGFEALLFNTTGNHNTADGDFALNGNTTGNFNTANGAHTLVLNTTGSSNIALGFNAGDNLTTGSNNIDIGNVGVAGESSTIRIGTVGTQTAAFIAGIRGAIVASGVGVFVGSNGQLGTGVSSERFKEAIKPMDKASEAILALKPVTFRYKPELDPNGIAQFGLVAEQVEKVNPDLVVRDAEGKPYTVRYEAVNAMLLNEFLKEHRKVQEQERKLSEQDRKVEEQETTMTQLKATVAKQEATIAQQEKRMEALTASLKERASEIRKVSDQLEASKATPQIVVSNK